MHLMSEQSKMVEFARKWRRDNKVITEQILQLVKFIHNTGTCMLILLPAHLSLSLCHLYCLLQICKFYCLSLLQDFTISFWSLTFDPCSILWHWSIVLMEQINTIALPEQFPVSNLLPSRLLLICHTQTADTTMKPETATHLDNVALKGNSILSA